MGRARLLAVMAQDLDDVPVSLLEGAIKEWVRTKAFMPKASEIRNLALIVQKATQPRQMDPSRQLAKDDGIRRSSGLFTEKELDRIVNSGAGSIHRDLLEMGLRAGFIILVGHELYQEAGGNVRVERRAVA